LKTKEKPAFFFKKCRFYVILYLVVNTTNKEGDIYVS